MILSTWLFKYAVQSQSTLTIFFHLVRHPKSRYLISKIHFHQSGALKLVETMLKSFFVCKL